MATPWEDPIKKNKQLTVFPASNVTSGTWSSVFTNALKEFNRLSSLLKLGVTLAQSSTAPDSKGEQGANVQFSIASGKASFKAFDQDFSSAFDGSGIHGLTNLVKRGTIGGNLEIARAFIFVPSTPMISVPGGRRQVGDGVKLYIAVHELVHACGLDNADHSLGSDPDIFMNFPQADSGSVPANDRIRLNERNLKAPPLFLTARTALLIQRNWT
jgi:hypothetical protein